MRQLTKKFFSFAVNKIFPAFILTSTLAQAAPQGGVIVGGQGSISSSTNTTTINQQTNSMVVDWSSFNVGSQETVNFNQPSSNAAALNRIYDQNPSQIFGAINANGRVFLSNPNGMIFGQTATVNVGALVATGLTISKDNFMNGNYQFNSDGYTPGAIINRGLLTAASGGSVSLIGGQVVNEGLIVADYGRIDLATGKQAILNFDGDGLINIQVSEDVLTNLNDAESSISNTGSLQANAGQIILDAHIAQDVFTNAINNEGVITAHRIENRGGEVYLFGNSGTTIHSGVIDAYGENGDGGTVYLLGDRVGLFNQASVDASGDTGGGTVLVGGDYQGRNPDVPNATRTYVAADTVITADAITEGDGGKVILWADDWTQFYGDISARGGEFGGDGGFVEVSGKQTLAFSGSVDTTATNGATGTLLLDPETITIINADDDGGADDDLLGPNDGEILDSQGPANTEISKGALENVSATTDINIQAKNSITFESLGTLALAQTSDNSATFTAGVGGIKMEDITNNITTAGGALTFNATGTGGVTLGDINTNGGTLTINVGGASSVDAITSGTGSLIKQGLGNLTLTGTNTYSGGTTVSAGTLTGTTTSLQGNITNNAAVVFDQATNGSYTDVISGSGTLTKQGSGNVTLSNTNTYSAGTTINAGTLTLGHATDTLADAGSINVNGGILAIGNNSDTVGTVTLTSGDITGTGGVLTGSNYVVKDGTISAILGGAGSTLTKATGGKVTLSGANTYTGTTTVSDGVLIAENADALGTDSGGATTTTTVRGDAELHLSGDIAFSAFEALTLVSSGNANGALYNVSGDNTWQGTIALGGDVSNAIDVASAQSLTASGVISGETLTKMGAGIFTLSNTNTYTGGTTVSNGTLTLGHATDTLFNTGLINVNGGILAIGNNSDTVGTVTLTSGDITGTGGVLTGSNYVVKDGTISAILGGAGSTLTKDTEGTVTLSGANTYTGDTNVYGGVLIAANADALGTDSGGATTITRVWDKAELHLSGDIAFSAFEALMLNSTNTNGALYNVSGVNTWQGTIALGADGVYTIGVASDQSLTVSGVISGEALLTKAGAGTLTLQGDNTYTGKTSIDGGILSVSADGNLGNTANAISINDGTLLVTADFTTSRDISLDGITNTIDVASAQSLTASGVISGGAENTLTKMGAGILTLQGVNDYMSLTTVSDGVLIAANVNALGTTDNGTTVASGATLDINTASINEAITLNGGSLIASTGTSTSTLNGNITLSADSTIGGNGDFVVRGVITTGANTLDILAGAASTMTFANQANDFDLVTVSSGNNITLVDRNSISLGVLNIGSNLDVSAVENITVNTIAAAGAAVTLNAGSTGADSGAIINGSPAAANNITADSLVMNAVTGIAAADQLKIDVVNLTVDNKGTGDINVLDTNDVTLLSATNDTGDINIAANNDLNLPAGLTATTAKGGDINFIAGNAINNAGAFTVDSAGSFSFNQALNAAGAVSITTANQLDITENITTRVGAITLDSTAISFSSGVVLAAADSIKIINADSIANGDLTFNAQGIDLQNGLTVNNGDLTLNAGNGALSIANALTVNNGDLAITAADLVIDLTNNGSIVGSNTVAISDSGNGMELGGTPGGSKLNISFNEYELITAGSLVLSTQNTLTLNTDSFITTKSTAPLTINANEFKVERAGAVLGLMSNLDLADTVVNAAADFTINVDGTFNMNNTITTNGAFTLTSGQGVTMGEPSSITSNNNLIDITTNGGDILLGLADAGTGNVNLTARAGSVLNNNGVFSDITRSKTNIKGTNTTIFANQRIGASSTDAITIDVSSSGLITLDFNADKAFINNLQNTRIQNNGSGDVAVGLIFSGQIIGVGHNVGINSQQTEEIPKDQEMEESLISILGSDYKLSAVEEEEEDSSTLNTVVPVMIRTKDGWEFKAPLRTPTKQKSKERKVNWL